MVVFLANEILLRHTMSQLKSSKEHGAIGVVAQLAVTSHLVLWGWVEGIAGAEKQVRLRHSESTQETS
jgi:hypothetical protein